MRKPRLCWALLGLVIFLGIHPLAAQDDQQLETGELMEGTADVVFLIDGSEQIGADNFQYVVDFLVTLVDSLEVGADRIRIGVVQYSEEPRTEFFLNSHATKAQVLDALNDLKFKGGDEALLGAALDFVIQNHFTPAGGNREEEGVPQTLIVITSAKSSDDVSEGALALKQASIFSFVIGVQNDLTPELQQIAIDSAFIFKPSDISTINDVEPQLSPYIHGIAMRTVTLGTSVVTEVINVNPRDILFLIDSSSALGGVNFVQIKNFVASLIQRLEIGEDLIRVALAHFSDGVTIEFDFNKHKTKAEAANAVKKIKLAGGRSLNIGAALQYARNNLFTRNAGSRIEENIPQLLVLLTGGKSKDSVELPAQELKNAGIFVLAVGGKAADEAELGKITLASESIFYVRELPQLATIRDNVLTPLKTLSGVIATTEGPTVYTGNPRDIIFLLDGSENVGDAGFPYVLELLLRIVRSLQLESDNIRIGVVQFSEDPTTEFYLNTYSTKPQVLDSIKKLRRKGGSVLNTGAALNYVLSSHLIQAAGSRIREGIPQILVLVSAAASDDEYSAASTALSEANVLTFCVGAGSYDRPELELIAFNPTLVYTAEDFSALPALYSEMIVPLVSFVSGGPEIPVRKRDILFLLDGSTNVHGHFPPVRDFVLGIIDDLNVGRDKDQIAIAQFSDNVKLEGNFNSFPSKDDAQTILKKMKPKGGRNLNTGAALDFALKNIFTPSAGSRIEDGVTQFLVLFVAGRSKDDVAQAADALKQAGIVSFGVGAKTVDTNELQLIASRPNFVVTVNEIRSLPDSRQNLFNLITTAELPTQAPTVPMDMLFLVDGSDGTEDTFSYMKDFVKEVARKLDIGPDGVRLALVQYSDTANPEFFFNDHTSKEDILNAIQAVRHRGGSDINTGAALNYAINNVFQSNKGSRINEGVRQVLILLTSGSSNDDISGSARGLRNTGIMTFAFGSGDADAGELQRISSSPNQVFMVQHFNLLPDYLQSFVVTTMRPSPPDEVPAGVKRDIVFLVDGSRNSIPTFSLVRSIIEHFVGDVDVGLDKVRIAVVQYSDDSSVEFNLNAHPFKDDVINAVRALQPKGGSRINTGSAIQDVSGVFIPSSGSRIEEGVPQFLIVLPSGPSSDSFTWQLLQLKASGVAPFAVGVGKADPNELRVISLVPEASVSISSAGDFPRVRQISEQLTTLTPDDIRRVKLPQVGGKRDVVFLIDGSRNSATNFPLMRRLMERTVNNMVIGPNNVRVAVVQYSDSARTEFLLNRYSNKDDVLNAIRNLRHMGGNQIRTGNALKYVSDNVFTRSAGSRKEEGVPQFLVVLPSGPSTDDVTNPSREINAAGVATFAVGVGNADIIELRRISLIPDSSVSISSDEQLTNIDGTIASLGALSARDVIKLKPAAVAGKRDIAFLVDGSTNTDFALAQNVIEHAVEDMDIGLDKVRVAVVQYDDNPRTEFQLNTYSSKDDVLNAVKALRQKGGNRINTGAALEFVSNNVFTRPYGSRRHEGVPQILVVLPSGPSNDLIARPATQIKTSGIAPFAIGLRNADQQELRTLSFRPEAAAAVITSTSDLERVAPFLTSVGTVTQQEIMKYRPLTVTGKKDVVFLVDGSQNMRLKFPLVQKVMESFVNGSDIGMDKVRVAVVQYSEDVKVDFLLNAHSSKEDVLNAIRRLRLKGGYEINTGGALEYVSRNVFTRPYGSRIEENVPQYLILLTNGPSADSVTAPSQQIKQSRVVPFAIDMGNADRDELRWIVYQPDYSVSITSVSDLPKVQNIMQTVETRIDRGPPPVQPTPAVIDPARQDIVFLVESSTNVGTEGLAFIRDFIRNVVQRLNIGSNHVRVGLVQYSADPSTEFLLKTHTSKEAINDALKRMRLKGGTNVNTGKALDFVMKNHFIKSAGSRIEEGVPQNLVLLTAGRSQDSVTTQAALLKRAGIKGLGIGAKNADITVLQEISSDPRITIQIRDFQDLPGRAQNIFELLEGGITYIKTVTPATTVETFLPKSADIVFIIDSSINFRRDEFNQVIQFVYGILENIYEDPPDDIRVGMVLYNTDVDDQFFFKTYPSKQDILDRMEKSQYMGGRTLNTGLALKHVLENHFVESAGNRKNVPQIAFIVTGGNSADDGKTAALALKNKGVRVFAVGVKNADMEEVTGLASESATAFRDPQVKGLSELNEQILVTLAASMKGGLCPGVPEPSKMCNVEVLVGFDVSNARTGDSIFAIQKGLEKKTEGILNQISNMHRISCTGTQAPSVKIGFLTYSRTSVVDGFDFVEYQPEMFKSVQDLQRRGPFFLKRATFEAYLNKFKTSGTAESVKVIIHLTDGLDENYEDLLGESVKLREGGVHALLLVGLEGSRSAEELMGLEFGRGFRYRRPLMINLLDLEHEVAEELDSITERVCCGVPCKCSGARGDPGSAGSAGEKGADGGKGFTGYPGEEGGPGERGPHGVNGTQGFRGCPGQRGHKGSRGYAGQKGDGGEIGLDGINGDEGDRGQPGGPGDSGNHGRRGPKGLMGERGERGELGLRGDPGTPGTDNPQRGPKGQKGDIGPTGPTGADGTAGSNGTPGKEGPAGRRGLSGAKGNPGGPGPRGSAGEQGHRGSQGSPGADGSPGIRGNAGIKGPRGDSGPVGPAGDSGKPGPIGKKGEPGETGEKGQAGSPGPRGEAGYDGRDGIGIPGPKGRKGDQGFPGYQGAKGEIGETGGPGGPGPKGNRGRRGYGGESGTDGLQGEDGYHGPPGLKGERGLARGDCELVNFVKDKCPCCYGPQECPVYPTELAFAIDSSTGVNRNTFDKMKTFVERIISRTNLTESNCPRGARVAILTYHTDVTTEKRFSDTKKKRALLEQIRAIQLLQTTKPRKLENAMSFVARNTFKRTRGGFLMKKLAIFFSNGPTKASNELNSAVYKLYDAGISSVFLVNREDRVLTQALQANNTDFAKVIVLPERMDDVINKVMSCHVCFDACNPDPVCGEVFRSRRSPPTDASMDLTFIMDSSHSTTKSQFAEMKKYISYIVDQLQISSDPKSSQYHARVALVQHAPIQYGSNDSALPVKVDFSLTDFVSKQEIQDYLENRMSQLQGRKALSHAIEYTIGNIFEAAPHPRQLRVIVLLVTGTNDGQEDMRLQKVISNAKCKGFFIVVLAVGKRVNMKDLTNLASEPDDVFYKFADKASELHNEHFLRFGQLLPKFISGENAFYLSPELRKNCDWFQNDQPENIPFKFNQRHVQLEKTESAVAAKPSEHKPLTQTRSSSTVSVTSVAGAETTINTAKAHVTVPRAQATVNSTVAEPVAVRAQSTLATAKESSPPVKTHPNSTVLEGFAADAALSTNSDKASEGGLEAPNLEDKLTSGKVTSVCQLPREEGTCREYELRWFYDTQTKSCTQFWYGGCNGNHNRFETQEQCEKTCISAKLTPITAIGT
ncbi:collagen alpha-3(VI) chain isoform X2 [Protopterus annectens]|uniref:collagen alpha-3(VI) chain isoform X2 n=1 Tax=Protopterus annectens TaxID=7888 RepID=UPI001CF9D3F4|nr:collagen alpha-3(VI) chain isoform X2 [Protopterus annectens]